MLPDSTNMISLPLIIILALAIASCVEVDTSTPQPAPTTAVVPATPVSAQQQPREVGINIAPLLVLTALKRWSPSRFGPSRR